MSDTPTFLSKAKILSLIAEAKADVKSEILAEIRNTEPTVNYDPDALTVYFFNGSFVGVGAGLLENEDFMEWNTATPQVFLDFFEDDEFDVIEEDYRDKNGNVCYDGNGNAIKQYKTKFYSHPFMHGKGTTAGGDEYEYFSIGKHGATIPGYRIHEAFGYAHSGQIGVTYKEHILLDTYQASKVVDGNGVTHIGSFVGGYPVAEIGVPETYIHPYRGYMEQGLRFEMQWLDILEAVCMGRRGEGYQSSASLELSNHFSGDALDIGGTSITTENDASNSFSVANTSAYAALAVGAQVSFDSVTNAYGARDGSTVITRTITAKSVGETNTTFTFDGDAVNVYGRRLHTSYMAATGATSGMTSYLNAYDANCPAGYQPFKVLNVEKPWGAHAYWLDWLRTANQSTAGMIEICVPNADDTVDNYGWVKFQLAGFSNSGNWIKTFNDTLGPVSMLVPGTVYSGDAVTHYGTKQYWHFANDNKCIFSGRNNQDNFQHGGQFSLCSCCPYDWSRVACSALGSGCWGRSFRSVR